MVDTLPQLLERLVAERGDAPFLRSAATWLSAREFAARSRALAHGLVAALVAPGDRVAIYMEKSPEKAMTVFAAGLAGAVSVVVNPKLKDAQVAHVLADADPRVVVTSSDKLVYLRDPARVLAGRSVYVLGRAPGLRGARRFADLERPSDASLPLVKPDDFATILYTSGSTGPAKGIVQDHRNLVAGARIVSGYLGLAPSDLILAILPLSFDYGLNQLLAAAFVPCAVALAEVLSAAQVCAAAAEAGATVLAGVPSLWHQVAEGLAAGKLPPECGAALRVVTSSGGRLLEQDIAVLRAHWPHVRVFSMYGLTEAFRSAFLPPEELDRRPRSFGRAIPEVELMVIDRATGRPCGPGETGELVHAGALVARGYWRNETATAAVFRPHPLDPGHPGRVVYSGDLVRSDADGFLYFVARGDAQLKVSGYRVSPEEVEAAVAAVPGVRQATVVGLPRADGVEDEIVACVVADPAEDRAELEERVLSACRRELPPYMVPARVAWVERIPLNENGKPDRRTLRASLGG
jgi:amino acid adenylation domain-containing protein